MTRVIHLLVYSAGHRATVPNTELHVKDTEMRETLPYTGLWSGGGGGGSTRGPVFIHSYRAVALYRNDNGF